MSFFSHLRTALFQRLAKGSGYQFIISFISSITKPQVQLLLGSSKQHIFAWLDWSVARWAYSRVTRGTKTLEVPRESSNPYCNEPQFNSSIVLLSKEIPPTCAYLQGLVESASQPRPQMNPASSPLPTKASTPKGFILAESHKPTHHW